MNRSKNNKVTRSELALRVSRQLRTDKYKKSVSIPRQVLHVSDDFGNSKSFSISRDSKEVELNSDDALAVINAAIDIIIDAVAKGETIYFRGFGTLDLKYRAPRRVLMPGTNDWVDVKGRYVPKFVFGEDLRRSANLYEMAQNQESYADPLVVEDESEEVEE